MKKLFAMLYKWAFNADLFEESFNVTTFDFSLWPAWAVDFMFDNADIICINIGDTLIRSLETGDVHYVEAKSVETK